MWVSAQVLMKHPQFFKFFNKQVKQVYNDQPLGILALGKIGGGYGSLISVVSRVPGYLVVGVVGVIGVVGVVAVVGC